MEVRCRQHYEDAVIVIYPDHDACALSFKELS